MKIESTDATDERRPLCFADWQTLRMGTMQG
jgi:hypothetical protein